MSPEALVRSLLPAEAALPVPPAGDAAWDQVRSSGTLAAVRERAEAELGTPWPQPLASQYARYFRDGNRTRYESQVFERQDRLTRAVLMATIGEAGGEAGRGQKWLDEAADGIVQLCEQSSWCWPAHEDTCRPRGTVLPDVATPCLDLGAADVAAQLAWADQALGDRLAERYPGLRERVRAEVRVRVLDPFVQRRDWHWLGLDGDVHNWCPWICGNVLVAALRLAEPGRSGPARSPGRWRASIVTSRRCRPTAPSMRVMNTGGTGHAGRSRHSTSWSTPRRGGSTRRTSRSCGRRSGSRTACIWAGRGI